MSNVYSQDDWPFFGTSIISAVRGHNNANLIQSYAKRNAKNSKKQNENTVLLLNLLQFLKPHDFSKAL